MFCILGPVLKEENHQVLGHWYFEETAWWQCVQESRKGEVKQIPDTVITTREQLIIRASGMNREYNRKKISNCVHPWFFHTLHTVSCSAPHLRKDAALLEKVH